MGADTFAMLCEEIPFLDFRLEVACEAEPDLDRCHECPPRGHCHECDDTGYVMNGEVAVWRERRRQAGVHPKDGHC